MALMKQAKRTGNLGEDMACQALAQAGYQIIERNWRYAKGEIDLVAREEETWAFVEVKARHGRKSGYPEEAVTPTKLTRIQEAAENYLAEHNLDDVNWRIDIVAIELDHANHIKSLRVLKGLTADEG